MTQTTLAQAAANWWINEMKRHCSGLYPRRVILREDHYVIIDAHFSEKLSNFQKILTEEIQKHIEKKDYFYLGCYHFPNRELSEIAKKADIHYRCFPPVIEIRIHGGNIEVSINNETPHKL